MCGSLSLQFPSFNHVLKIHVLADIALRAISLSSDYSRSQYTIPLLKP